MAGSTEIHRGPVGYDSLTVAVVARMVGVAPSTLRTWARRYGLEPSGHRSGLHRRYSETDVARLRYMRTLTQAGMTSRDAASRAMAATLDELATTPGAGRPVPELDRAAGLRPDLGGPQRLGPDRGPGLEVGPPVRTLLSTLGHSDAQGATALLRLALRDLGAARTWDERVAPCRTVLRRLPAGRRGRGPQLLDAAVLQAVGDVRLRRERRSTVPVHVVTLPGHDDVAARLLLAAALAERSIATSDVTLGTSPAAAARLVSGGLPGLLVVHVSPDPVATQLAGRLRQLGRGAEQVHWGEGWVHWPGQDGGMTDVVRVVEAAVCPPLPE